VLNAHDVTLHSGQSIAVQDMFSLIDTVGNGADGYQINDIGHHIALNGATNYYLADQYKGFYGIFPSELPQVTYVAGAPGTDTITIEAGAKGGFTGLGVQVHITILPNPVLTPTTVSLAVGQTVPVTSLFNATNPSGKPLAEYSFVDPIGGGTLYLNGARNLASGSEQANGTVTVSATDLAKLTYQGASSFAVDALTAAAYDGDSWGSVALPVTTIDGAPPQVSALAASVEVDSTVPLSSLFAAVSHSGLPITEYEIINPNGGGKLVLGGALNSASAQDQAQQGMAIVSAADFSKLSYVGADAPGTEKLTIAAFDGQSWGSAQFALASVRTAPPVVAAQKTFVDSGQPSSLASLFSVSGPNGSAAAYYIFQDPEHQIVLNGATNLWGPQESAGYYWISAADIGKVNYLAYSAGVYHFSVIVNDGFNFSQWSNETVVVGKDQLTLPPVVSAAVTSVAIGQDLALGSLFTVSDPIDNAITQYRVRDPSGGGSIELNGVTDLASASEHAQGIVVFAAADLPRVQYEGGSGTDTESLTISAYDGLNWGAADIAVSTAILPPVVKPGASAIEFDHSVSLGSLFSVSTSSGNAVSQIKVQDPSGGGHVDLAGVANLATVAQQAQGISIFSASELSKVQYDAAASKGSETLLFSAFDGQSWGTSNLPIATIDTRAPALVQTFSNVDVNATVNLNTLFAGTSVSGKPIVEYLITDPSGGGHVDLNTAPNLATAAQASAGTIAVAAYDLGTVLYVGASGTGTETLTVTAFDGQQSTTANITIHNIPAALPVVTTGPITLGIGDSVYLKDLFPITDPNGHPIKWYFVMDADLGIDLNGAANLAVSPFYDYHGHYDFNNAADWAKVKYVANAVGSVRIGMQADDGFGVSNFVEAVVTTVPATGGTGDDLLHGTAANDSIDGGPGYDTLVYNGARSQYTLSHNSDNSLTVRDTTGAAGTDSVRNVELIQFSDSVLSFDIDGNAGKVFRMFEAALGRAPRPEGLGFWLAAIDHGASLKSLAQTLIDSAEFSHLNGATPSVDSFVATVLANTHGGTDNATVQHWLTALGSGSMSEADALVSMSESSTNQAQLIGVEQTGMAYIAWHS
jgi:hypothetical protein